MTEYIRSGWFVFDTETGGLNPKETSLLTLSGMVVDNNFKKIPLTQNINLIINHELYHVTGEALEVNQINLSAHHNQPNSQYIYEAGNTLYRYLMPYVTDKIVDKKLVKQRLGVIGHNVEFDKAFVLESGLLTSWGRFFSREVLDTKVIAEFLKNCNILPTELQTHLGALAAYYDVDVPGDLHNAEVDMTITLEVLQNLLRDVRLLQQGLV